MDIVVSYMAQRLSICGFMLFHNVHFYDLYAVFSLHRNIAVQAKKSLTILFKPKTKASAGLTQRRL